MELMLPISTTILSLALSFGLGYYIATRTIRKTQDETGNKIIQLISKELGVIVEPEEEEPKAEKKEHEAIGYLR